MGIFTFLTSVLMCSFYVTNIEPDNPSIPVDDLGISEITEFTNTYTSESGNMVILAPASSFSEQSSSAIPPDIEPGLLPEGDNMAGITFSPDGSKVLVSNSMSKSVTVINWAAQTIDTTFSVNGEPHELSCTDNYIIVPMQYPASVAVYNRSDYSLASTFLVPDYDAAKPMPFFCFTSPDERFAYVPIVNTTDCMVINLSTLEEPFIIHNISPAYGTSTSSTGHTNRSLITFPDFVITPDGKYIVTQSHYRSKISFYNTTSGAIDHSIDVEFSGAVALSGDGKYLIAESGRFPLAYIKINLSNFKIESTVTLQDGMMSSTVGLVVNQDGTKALAGSYGTAYLLRFTPENYKKMGALFPYWMASNYDHTLAVTGLIKISVFDFASETVKATVRPKEMRPRVGCTSPTANEIAFYSPLGGLEAVRSASFSNSSVSLTGSVMSGSPIEGDGSRRVAISPNASVAVIANYLSKNISILNMQTRKVEALLDVGGFVENLAITSDSKWAVVCTGTSNNVKIINLETNAIVASIPTGEWCTNVSITPDDSYAYVCCINNDVISVIKLDGASSSKIKDIACSGLSGSFAPPQSCGVFNNAPITSDGRYCLAVAGDDDMVRLIDTATNTIVANIAVGNFPANAIFNADGSKAIVTNLADDTYSLINIDGASSSLITTKACGDRPSRVGYNPVADQFAVAISQEGKVKTVDINTGSVIDTYNYPGYVIDFDYTDTGERLVLISNNNKEPRRSIYKNSERVFINSYAVFFDYNALTDVAIAAAPGPDYITCIDFDNTAISQQNITISDIPQLAVSPNPGSDHFAFDITLPYASQVNLTVFDLSGRMISNIEENSFTKGNYSFKWNAEIPTGVYALRLDACEKTVTKLFTVYR